MTNDNSKLRANAQRVWSTADLSQNRAPAHYLIINEGDEPTKVLLSKRRRQVMDLLLKGPVYCASPVRLSDIVHLLKRETGVIIDTEYFPGNKETGAGSFGIYQLKSHVTLLDKDEVAA